VVNATPGRFTPEKKTRYSFYGRCVGLGCGLDDSGKSSSNRLSNSGPSSLYRVAIPTTTYRPLSRE
jgi:hypothetical protein